MSNRERLERAVHNNAVWCDSVCRAYGSPGEFLDGIWINRGRTPRFYPNAVTLANDRGVAAQVEQIRTLSGAGIPGAWGVKDSFCALDLAPLGFQVLFEARWIWRPASLARPGGRPPGVSWKRIAGASELAEWERAWGGGAGDETDADAARVFLPSLLGDDDVAFVAAYRDRRIVAGAIANRTGDVVGISNMFVRDGDDVAVRAGCVAAVIDAFPDRPIAGYEMGDDLTAMGALGFDRLGPLRVWEVGNP